MKCDRSDCLTQAAFTVTAAYRAPGTGHLAHPQFASYPMPLARACPAHLADAMLADAFMAGATPAYVVKVVGL